MSIGADGGVSLVAILSAQARTADSSRWSPAMPRRGESACEPVTAVEAQSAAESHVLFGADPASEAVDHRNDVVVRNGRS